MSAGLSAAAWLAVAAVATTATSLYNAKEQRTANSQALDQQREVAAKNAVLSDEANNRANAKKPDIMALMSANALSGKAGQSGTMLTGPSGVDPASLTLGKSTLLGG